MIRTLVFTAALASAGAATAQDPHAGDAEMQHQAPAASGIVTTPADGAMMQGSPERFSATFPNRVILKTVTLTAKGQAPIVVTAPTAPAAATVSVALPRFSAGTYTAAWNAEGPDGHPISGSISFMIH